MSLATNQKALDSIAGHAVRLFSNEGLFPDMQRLGVSVCECLLPMICLCFLRRRIIHFLTTSKGRPSNCDRIPIFIIIIIIIIIKYAAY